MSDLFRKQDLIDAIYVQSDDNGYYVATAEDMEKIIKGLPSVEPDVPDTNVDNMISQQDAIKAVARAIWHYPKPSLLNNYHFAYELAEDALKQLPSAESWRKTGKWIYLGDGYKCPWSCSKCSSCSDERTDYCPMCGAKMEGEKDG